jgi:type I restriction enzyme S subunit
MSFPRYPRYKDTGVEWLGEMPQHWQVQRLKHACSVFPSNVDKKSHEGETPVLLCNYTDVYYSETITAGMDFMAATASPDQIAKFTLRAGDTIITKDSETADDIAIAAYVPADVPGLVCGYHLSIVRPLPGTDGAFVKRLFDSSYAKSCFAVRANGLTRVGLGQYELDNIKLPFPPSVEQTLISAFLDQETAKIDELVAEQQRLMELLKEKRQAVTSNAVTRGLDPHVPLRAAETYWFDKIPNHWSIIRLRHACSTIFLGLTSKVDYVEEGGVPLVRALNISGGVLDLSDVRTISLEQHRNLTKRNLAKRGDVLLSKSGSIGTAAIVDCDVEFSIYESIFALRAIEQLLLPRYLLFLLRSAPCYAQYSASLVGMGVGHLNMSDIVDVRIALPPLKEQASIVDHLEAELGKLRDLAVEAERTIDLLQERRTALISAAVTGQIDVRAFAERRAA